MRVNLIHSILVFREKNIVHITVRVNLIHFKLVYFLKKNVKKFNTLKKKKREQCISVHCLTSFFFLKKNKNVKKFNTLNK